MENIHASRVRISSADIGPNAEARPSALMNLLQDAATEHAIAWKLSAYDLLPQGRTWVLARYHLELLRAPRVGEELLVETWPSGLATTFATRDFEVRDTAGAPVVRASTSWAMLDVVQKKPVPLEGVVPPDYQVARRAVDTRFPTLPRLEVAEREVRLPVMLRDLDINAHVNHVVYVQWALETVPLEVWKSFRLKGLEVAYRAEARHGESIVSRRGAAEPDESGRAFVHQIVQADNGTELARLRTRWEPRG